MGKMELREREEKKQQATQKTLKDKGKGQGQGLAQKQSWLHANELKRNEEWKEGGGSRG